MTTITEAKIKAQQPKDTVVWWDDCLGCRISANKVSWLVKAYIAEGDQIGRQVKHAFGSYPSVSLKEARAKAAALYSQIRKGTNPNETRRQQRRDREAKVQLGSVADLMHAYIKEKRKPGRYWGELAQTFERDVISVLGRKLIAEVTFDDVNALIKRKRSKHPGAARSLFWTLNKFFRWCVTERKIAASPMNAMEAPEPPVNRDRILYIGEIKAFWSATLQEPAPYNAFYRVLLLTAQRREEVAGMCWSEIDLAKAEWTIPKERTKNGKAHLVHLSPQALAALPAKGDNQFVFPSEKGSTSISGYSKAKARLDKNMRPQSPWRVHDLRRTAASGMAALGFQPHIIERVLNHLSGAQGGLVSVYQRHEYLEERRRALLVWAEHVESLVSDRPMAKNVVPLRA